MEEYANNKIETFDELITKHTRRELEELALKFGLENLGGTKSQLAESILEAMKKQKEPPKSIPQVSPKEASMIEKQKSAVKPAGFGKKGVLAKANATNMLSRNMHSEGQKMIEDGQKRFNQGQVQFKQSIDAQIKENSEATAKLHSGAREIRSSQEKMSREFQKAGKSIRDDGYRNLQNGLAKFQSNLFSQIKENREAVSKLNSGARELQGRAASFQNEIHKYQEQDLKNYVRDFYYG